MNTVVELDQYLTFDIANEEFAIEILRVKEIIQYDEVTRIPQVPACIRGVINLRGGVVPVVDLGLKFHGEESLVGQSTCIVIVEVEHADRRTVMGVLADAVNEVLSISPEQIEDSPEFGTSVNVRYLRGLGKAGKKFVLILDVDEVLAHDELLAVSTAAEPIGEITNEGSDPVPEEQTAEESTVGVSV